MHPKGRRLPVLLLLTAAAFFSGCHKTAPRPRMGDEWRGMTHREKQMFVSGYLDGTSSASFSLCHTLEAKVSIPPPPKEVIGPAETMCEHVRPQYTHVSRDAFPGALDSVDPYVRVLDDFYAHSDCRVMPYIFLLEHLNDAEYRSGEDLYKFVRGNGTALPGDRSWGFFTIEGIDKCYGADSRR